MNVSELRKRIAADLDAAKNVRALEDVRVKYLGRERGQLTALLRSLKDFSLEEKRKVAPVLQELRASLEKQLHEKLTIFKAASSVIPHADVTAPAKKMPRGHLHPLTLVEQEARRIFAGMNFSVVEGPEIESEYYNFDALNIPADHPARDMWDTFWLKEPVSSKLEIRNSKLNKSSRLLLRTHTSPVQVRYMEHHEPPFQIVVPGRTFRYEATDASHEVNFYQLEGLMVGRQVTLANFKFVVEEFLKRFFSSGGKQQKIEFRFRPSYFPFVEPGIEVDMKFVSGRKGEKPKWLEVMGAGMVHPRVFEYAHYNPRDWQGFAFGVGLDRLAMIKYKIPDIRLFYAGDDRFIRQF